MPKKNPVASKTLEFARTGGECMGEDCNSQHSVVRKEYKQNDHGRMVLTYNAEWCQDCGSPMLG